MFCLAEKTFFVEKSFKFMKLVVTKKKSKIIIVPFIHTIGKSQIFVQKFNFDKTLQFSREIKVVHN